MTFTYSVSDLTSALAKVRLAIGDTDSTTALFQDEEITSALDGRGGDVLLAAADLCDMLARRFARRPDFTTDNQSFKWSHVARQYADLATQLRARASGLTSVSVTRIDGYSQDVANRDVQETGTNPRRRYYGEPDAPF